MPTFITEVLPPSCYLTTAVLNDCYSEVTAYTSPAYSYWATTRMDPYVTPTNDTDYVYSCHIETIEHIYGVYIMPHHATSYS